MITFTTAQEDSRWRGTGALALEKTFLCGEK
jgi:hypothetical protein